MPWCIPTYDITDEPLDNRDIKRLPSQVQARIDDLYELAQHDPTQAIPELERLVTTYPHVPTFFNYLSIAYLAAGDQEQATALVREAYRRHPQYLFAKVNYANLCLQQGEIEKVPSIFDHACDLKQLYPHRTRFHVSEFTGFAWVMCRYFCAIGEWETAALYYQMLKQVAPRHPMTKHAKRSLYPHSGSDGSAHGQPKGFLSQPTRRRGVIPHRMESGGMTVQVKLKDIIEGMDFQSDEQSSFLNLTTGEVVSVTDEELRAAEENAPLEDFPEWQHDAIRIARDIVETDHYLPLPDRFEINEYRSWSVSASR